MEQKAEKTIDEKIQEARAKREAMERARQEREDAAAKEQSLKDELQEIANLEALEKLESKFGADRIARVDVPDGRMVVLRAPKGVEYHRYIAGKGQGLEDMKKLVATLVEHPSKELYDVDILAKYPAMTIACMKEVNRLAGIEGKEQQKK